MFNKATLIGRLGQDPDVRMTKDQKPVVNLTLATTEFYKSKSGERQQRTEWHRVVLFGKLAEIARDHLKKGALVLVEGPIRTRKWTDNANLEHSVTEIFPEVMKMLSPKSEPSTKPQDFASHQVPDISDYDEYDDLSF